MLIEAGLVTRSQNPTHAARMYVLEPERSGGSLAALVSLASSRQGRAAIITRLRERTGGEPTARIRGSRRTRRLLEIAHA